ncbi:MAG: ABC transporter permease subunit [Pirellulales bacterium]|nr:ABC transporter permease subunit [Pirellulales bacterium]
MIRQPIKKRTAILLGVASICLLVMVYGWLSWRQHRANPKDTTIPNLSQFVEGWKRITTTDAAGDVWILEDAAATYGRLALGLLTGVGLAVLFGMAMGCFAKAEAFCLPPLGFLAKIPPTAMLAVYFVMVGTEMKMYVAMIALGIFPTLAQAIYQAARNDVSDHALYKAYTLGASHLEVICCVVFRQILPRILESVRLQIGPAMVFLIAAEWAVADVGFGYRLRIQSRLLNMNVVYSYLIILGTTGLLMDWLLSFTRRKLCPWFGE